MDAVDAARRIAESVHRAAVERGANPWRLLEFVLQEAANRSILVYGLPPDDPQLKGGQAVFDSQAQAILYTDAGTDFDRAFLIAHELGHVFVDGGKDDAVTQRVEPDRSVEDAPVGIEKVLDYGARERREVRMDLFARELLLPRALALALHVDQGMSAVAIAERLGARLAMVQQQLLDALLLPAAPAAEPVPKSSPVGVDDPSQETAARHSGSALLLQAGPGTGKTRTLVRRVEHLLAEGVPPSSILVLTFSNKAAGELSERISAGNRAAAAAMWIGTFHSFGLDIVRRFHDRLDLPADPRVIDRTEGIELLEEEFPRLPLRHYRNLWDPTTDLGDILNAVSRAQDEVVDVAGYRALAAQMLTRAAGDAEATVRAEKCAEVGIVFEAYERLKKKEQAVDFGDLVALPVRLVEGDAEVRAALQSRHRHILVDEYQDVNHASVRLLKAIAGTGEALWVVGDARQSIYRFRGAASSNVARFGNDFPGAQVSQLALNYRSRHEIIETFATFSRTMKASTGTLPLRLSAQRGVSGVRPELRVAVTGEDEVSAIAAAIEEQRRSGVAHLDQAVLCASNARLGAIAEGLEARGIPVLHLGSLFERPEIKDLLALLSLFCDGRATGLVRVATVPVFNLPLQDVADVLKYTSESEIDSINWAGLGDRIPSLSDASRRALAQIEALFAGIGRDATAWSILAHWVIDRLGIAKTIYRQNDLTSRMQGLALWQFMNFCRRQPVRAGVPARRLLDRIRRLVLLAEDRGLHRLPHAAGAINAVRLLTIHASKGLEFDVVHIPGLVTSGLPRNNTPPRCLPPDGLIHAYPGMTGLDAVKAGHEEEEECLFFVALSRARDRLMLYGYRLQADGRARHQSKFIPPIANLLTRSDQPSLLPGAPRPSPVVSIEWEQKPRWNDDQINLFERCPRRFFYTHVLRARGRRTETPFLKMHNVVLDVMDWLKAEHAMTHPSDAEVEARFAEAWRTKGAVDHGYAEDYLRIGRRLVYFLLGIRQGNALTEIKPLTLAWPECEIIVTPDNVVKATGGQLLVRRIKTGKQRSNEFDDIEFTIFHLAVTQAYGSQAVVEVVYLTSETKTPMTITARKVATRSEKMQKIVRQIQAGDFPLEEDARVCPRCPSFFVCGSLPSGPLRRKS